VKPPAKPAVNKRDAASGGKASAGASASPVGVRPEKKLSEGASPLDVITATFVTEARTSEGLPPPSCAEIAFAGRSNVGKSTLLNAIAQRKGLARTSATPGCTRGLVLFELVLRGGEALRVVDLPGYGFAARARDEKRGWGEMIEGYLASGRPTLAGVCVLVDARRGPEEEERQLVGFLSSVGVSFVFVATKIDKLAKNERFSALERITREFGARVIGVSGDTGEGRDDLVRAMRRLSTPK
jgi:GTP-binding protein